MTETTMPLLSCRDLDITVHECTLVQSLSLSLWPGSITAVLGRNGTGKSLTLRTLAGLRDIARGEVILKGKSLPTLSRRDIARTLGFVAQESDEPFPVTVLECAVSGRHPHLDFWQWETSTDFDLARAALDSVDMAPFADRSVETLSGGERRRLALATALAQSPEVFILDEPTNHLDPQHQLQMFELMRARANAGAAVLMSLHDPNLALRFADQSLLLFGDGRWLAGASADILDESALSALYRVPMQRLMFEGQTWFVAGITPDSTQPACASAGPSRGITHV